MNEARAIWTAAVVIALFCAGWTPGRARAEMERAAIAVALVWLLFIWSKSNVYLTPVQAIYGATGVIVDPKRLWAMQDAALACYVYVLWDRGRNWALAAVGGALVAQIGLHAAFFGQPYRNYRWPMDLLFMVQLAAVAMQGGWHIGGLVRDFCRRLDWRALARRAGGVGAGAPSRSGDRGAHGRVPTPGASGGLDDGRC